MNTIILFLIPLAIISLAILGLFGTFRKIRFGYFFGVSLLNFCLLYNTILIIRNILPDQFMIGSYFYVDYQLLWIYEIIYSLFLITLISSYNFLQKTHNQEKLLGLIFLILCTLLLIFSTQNLIIISTLTIILLFEADFLYYFGTLKKSSTSLVTQKNRKIFGFSILIFYNIYIYYQFQTVNLPQVIISLNNASDSVKNISIYGLLMIISALFLMGPFSCLNCEHYYGKSNFLHLRVNQTIVLPLVFWIYLRIIVLLESQDYTFGIVIFIFGFIGCIICLYHGISELYGLNINKSQNFLIIMGVFSNLLHNVFLLLISISNLSFSMIDSDKSQWINLFLFLSIGFITLIWEAFLPILDHTTKRNLPNLFSWANKYPSFIFIIIYAVFFLVGPGFPGFVFMQNLMRATFIRNAASPSISGLLWFNFLIIIFVLLITVIASAVLIVQVFFGNQKTLSKQIMQSSQSGLTYLISPTLLMLSLIMIFFYPGVPF